MGQVSPSLCRQVEQIPLIRNSNGREVANLSHHWILVIVSSVARWSIHALPNQPGLNSFGPYWTAEPQFQFPMLCTHTQSETHERCRVAFTADSQSLLTSMAATKRRSNSREEEQKAIGQSVIGNPFCHHRLHLSWPPPQILAHNRWDPRIHFKIAFQSTFCTGTRSLASFPSPCHYHWQVGWVVGGEAYKITATTEHNFM